MHMPFLMLFLIARNVRGQIAPRHRSTPSGRPDFVSHALDDGPADDDARISLPYKIVCW